MVCILASLPLGTWASVDFVRIPMVRSTEQAPVIDGKMQGSEWKYAVALLPIDPWAPWCKDSTPVVEIYTVTAAPAKIISPVSPATLLSFPSTSVMLPFTVDCSTTPMTISGGEVSFRFRLERVPPAKLSTSVELAKFLLKGKAHERGFVLHAYSGNSGIFLNGIMADRDRPRQHVLLARGAATPHNAPHWDTQWHTVHLAWCRGQLAARWDGLPILHLIDPDIDYTALTLSWAKSGVDFSRIELSPFELRAAHFSTLTRVMD